MTTMQNGKISVCFISALIAGLQFVSVVQALPAYPLRADPSQRYLIDTGNVPIWQGGETGWNLMSITTADADFYLDSVKSMGFTTVLCHLASRGNCPVPSTTDNNNRCSGPNGVYPFSNNNDFSTHNEAYFAHVDTIIDHAAAHGIALQINVFYIGYGCDNWGWSDELAANSDAKCTEFGRWVGSRYAHDRNIVWIIGYDEYPSNCGVTKSKLDLVAQAITESDTLHKLMSGVVGDENTSLDEWTGRSWNTYDACYTYSPGFSANYCRVYMQCLAEYNRTRIMPVYLTETGYEGEVNRTRIAVRASAWWAFTSGMAGFNFGNNPLWFFGGEWKTTTGLLSPGHADMRRMLALINSRPWYDMVPDSSHSTMTAGFGTYDSDDYYTGMRAADGRCYIAFMPGTRQAAIDMTKISGTRARASWYNPADGSTSTIGIYATTGTQNFTPPANDRVLVIDDSSMVFPAPGTAWTEELPLNTGITSPAEGAVVGVGTISLESSPSDVSGIRKVEYYRTDLVNSVLLLGTASASPFTLNWTGVAAGSYTVYAKAYDNRGTSRWSNPVSFTVSGAVGALEGAAHSLKTSTASERHVSLYTINGRKITSQVFGEAGRGVIIAKDTRRQTAITKILLK